MALGLPDHAFGCDLRNIRADQRLVCVLGSRRHGARGRQPGYPGIAPAGNGGHHGGRGWGQHGFRALGSGRISDASRATGNAFVVFWSVAITVTVTGLVFTEPILDLLAGFGATILAVVVNNQLMAGGGALAAYAVGARVQTFMIMPQTGISQGMQPIVGYNHGLRKAARVTGALRLSIASTLTYSILAAMIVALLAQPIAGLFLRDQTEVNLAAQALRILCVGIAVSGVVPLVSAYYQSIGKPSPAYLLAVGTLMVIKLPLVLIIAKVSGAQPTALWWAIAAGEIGAAIIAAGALWYGKKHDA